MIQSVAIRYVPAGRHATRFISTLAPNEMAYSEKRLIGFTREQMFSVVANVSEYKQFIPWCRRSDVTRVSPNLQVAALEIGFPPFNEGYASRVSTVEPSVVRSVCIEKESLFQRLETTFRFERVEGEPKLVYFGVVPHEPLGYLCTYNLLNKACPLTAGFDILCMLYPKWISKQQMCTLRYDLIFEFKSAFHSRIAHLFFDKVVKTMVGAFLHRAEEKYGPPVIPHEPPQVLQYKS